MSDLSTPQLGTPPPDVDLYERVGDRLALFDPSGVLLQCNEAYAQAVGRPVVNLIGRSISELCEAAPRLLMHRRAVAENGGRGGSSVDFDEHLARWVVTRAIPQHPGTLLVSWDADGDLVRQHQVARQVTRDEPTGLPNAIALREELTQVQPPYELLAIEVDHVARIAEAVGQEAATLMMLGISDNIDAVLLPSERLFRSR